MCAAGAKSWHPRVAQLAMAAAVCLLLGRHPDKKSSIAQPTCPLRQHIAPKLPAFAPNTPHNVNASDAAPQEHQGLQQHRRRPSKDLPLRFMWYMVLGPGVLVGRSEMGMGRWLA